MEVLPFVTDVGVVPEEGEGEGEGEDDRLGWVWDGVGSSVPVIDSSG